MPYRSPRLGNPRVFYTFYLVYIWHYRIKLFLRHLPNCPCSNFSRYVDLFQEISQRIAKQLRFQVKLHYLRQKCKNDNPGFFNEWNTCNEKPRCAPNIFLGKYKSLKKHNTFLSVGSPFIELFFFLAVYVFVWV